ncbi:hypothetical protein TthHC11_20720 (plasmid) [Thermus thermophilus]|uniref:hypothetical protein n=1 Tax=Thermus thermophilus TaxID=274 RepID=UPI00116436F9|nr:hypothetical protein [Thermus thermophilus]BBL94538.1 hypothetical protein TthHC11_20720 [Thermus thermophilus]
MTRPRRSFQSLLLQALVEAEAGNLGALQAEAFREEARRHLAMGPRGEDPIGQALYLGREALYRLSLGDREEACAKLLQALRLHPYLGGGYAARLVEVLCGERTVEEGSRRGDRALLEEARPEVRLLAFLDGLPPAFWVEAFWPKGEGRAQAEKQGPQAARGEQPSFTRPERRPPSPSRPRLVLAYRPLPREKPPEGEKTIIMRAFLIQDSARFPTPRPQLRRWVAPGGLLEVREGEGELWVRLSGKLWEAYPRAALLVLKGGEQRVLVPLIFGLRTQLLPVAFQEGEDLLGEVWLWEDLTLEALRRLLQETHFHPDVLAAWLIWGLAEGWLDAETLRALLKPE